MTGTYWALPRLARVQTKLVWSQANTGWVSPSPALPPRVVPTKATQILPGSGCKLRSLPPSGLACHAPVAGTVTANCVGRGVVAKAQGWATPVEIRPGPRETLGNVGEMPTVFPISSLRVEVNLLLLPGWEGSSSALCGPRDVPGASAAHRRVRRGRIRVPEALATLSLRSGRQEVLTAQVDLMQTTCRASCRPPLQKPTSRR